MHRFPVLQFVGELLPRDERWLLLPVGLIEEEDAKVTDHTEPLVPDIRREGVLF